MTVTPAQRFTLRQWLPGLAVALAGMAGSYALWQQQTASVAAMEQVRFTQEARSFSEALELRLGTYTETLHGLRSLFAVKPDLSRADFESVARDLDLLRYHASVKNVAFTRQVPGADRAAFEAHSREDLSADGTAFPDFTVHPPGERPEYLVVEYLWPHTGNEGVLGLDIHSQPANAESMRLARETGKPVASAPFDLVQEKVLRTGFILRVPVFVDQAASGGLERRFLGAVGATVRVHDMVASLREDGYLKGIALSMEDIGAVGGPGGERRTLLALEEGLRPEAQPYEREVRVGGRRWRLAFHPAGGFLTASERQMPWMLGLGGMVVTLLLTALVTLLSLRRAQALGYVKVADGALRESEQRLRGILYRMPVGVCLVHKGGAIGFRNERFEQICGYDAHDVPDVESWWRLLFPDAEQRALARAEWQAGREEAARGDGSIRPSEWTITAKDGQVRTVEIAGVLLGEDHLVTVVDLSQRKAAEEEIRYLAYYDPLTRLPNRRLLQDRLQQALAVSARRQRCGAVLMLDLDNFKTLNETQGHEKGDLLLREVAQRLRACVQGDDTVARHGGDEFVVVLEDLDENPQEAGARAEETGQRILAALRQPFLLGGETHHSTLSMGITVFQGQREPADELLKRGELAMYQAKAAGRNALQFYDPQMQAAVAARVALESDMRAGLERGQFELFYQPQVVNGRIMGAEALLRWRHPEKGFISPAEFIPLAEDCGLILPLGEWVLRTACERLARWAQHPGLAHLGMSVNVSPRQFHQSGFVSQVLAALAGTGADGRHLKLELTEGLLLQDVQDTIDKMGQLRAYGVGFSLDDFGTGYSSLAYLKRLPLDELKIDQSFVRDVLTDPNDAAIARTIVALGTSLGLRVIAEGVETEAQRAFLERNHCHAWQGYLLSAPIMAADYEALVLRQAEAHA